MGHSLLFLHVLIEFPEINKLFASCYFHNFKVFPFLFQFTIIFATDLKHCTGLKWWPWTQQ